MLSVSLLVFTRRLKKAPGSDHWRQQLLHTWITSVQYLAKTSCKTFPVKVTYVDWSLPIKLVKKVSHKQEKKFWSTTVKFFKHKINSSNKVVFAIFWNITINIFMNWHNCVFHCEAFIGVCAHMLDLQDGVIFSYCYHQIYRSEITDPDSFWWEETLVKVIFWIIIRGYLETPAFCYIWIWLYFCFSRTICHIGSIDDES